MITRSLLWFGLILDKTVSYHSNMKISTKSFYIKLTEHVLIYFSFKTFRCLIIHPHNGSLQMQTLPLAQVEDRSS